MHWFFDYPWGPTLTWLVVVAVLAVLGVSFWTVRKEIKTAWGLSVIGLRLLALVIVVFLLLQPQTKFVKETKLQSYTGVLIDTSKSMNIKDANQPKTRMETARDLLFGEVGAADKAKADEKKAKKPKKDADPRNTPLVGASEDSLAAKIRAKGNMKIFQFSTTLEEVPLDRLSDVREAGGDSTALGSAIAEAVEKFGGEDLTSLVIISDGIDNAGRKPSEVAATLGVPLFIVGIGSKAEAISGEEKDYAVDNVTTDKRVMVNKVAQVQVSVSSRGFPNRPVKVELLHEGKVLAANTVSLGPTRPKSEAIIPYTPTVPGKYVYVVRIPVENEEINKENNQRLFTVQVIDPVNRLLYVEGTPRWDYKFLNRVFNENRNLNAVSYLKIGRNSMLVQGAGATGADVREQPPLGEGELEEFKVLILGDVGRDFFAEGQLERIAKFVESGGSLLVVGGKQNFGANGYANTPLARVLPITPDPSDKYNEVKVGVTTTPDGAAHPVFQDIKIDWSLAQELGTVITTGNLKAGATALLTSADGKYPIVVVQSYGQGRSVVLLSDSTWSWKLGQAAKPLPIDLHNVFWSSLIDWLLPRESVMQRAKAVELITDKDEYELNQEVHLIVTVTDADGHLVKDAVVRCEVQTSDNKTITQEAQLGEIPSSSASMKEGYTTFFTPHKSGKYSVTATAEKGGQEIGREELSFVVGDPALEFRVTDLNSELLQDLAKQTKGKYYTPETAAQLLDDIVAKEKKVTRTEKKEVWNEWWVLVVFIALMTSEWIVRKKRQMA